MPNILSAAESIDIEAILSLDRFALRSVDHMLFAHKSHKTAVYGFTSREEDYVLKVYIGGLRYAKKEHHALHICSEILPNILPNLISYQLEYMPYYLLYRKINGTPLSSLTPSLVTKVLPEVVNIVRKFSSIKLDHYGEIVGEYEGAPNTRNLYEYIRHISDHWLCMIASNSHRHIARHLKAFVADHIIPEGLLAESPSFSHSDLRLENIFLRDNGITIIDYDNAFAFLPEFDLCKTYIDLLDNAIPFSIEDYASLIANSFSVSEIVARRAIMRFYWFVALRKMSFYCRMHDSRRFEIEYQRLLYIYNGYKA